MQKYPFIMALSPTFSDAQQRACLVEGVSVSLQQTNTKLTPKIQTYVLVWC
jgi:hypothetical protein